jgi:bifunctional non-homologous end joining protein LigD
MVGALSVVDEVGAGFSEAERRRLYALVVNIPRAGAIAHGLHMDDGVRWVDPVHVGEVAFRG